MSDNGRRQFIAKFGILSLSALSATTLLQACANGEAPAETKGSPSPKPAPAPAAAEEKVAENIDCSTYNKNLTETDLKTRESLGYIEQSEKADQNCSNCRFYNPAKFKGDCGACQLFANGAVASGAWCKTWAVKEA
tara:strand:- start:3631 stop:4038 length:408 start_codon:yes stop_codon:yes gene_type:complete